MARILRDVGVEGEAEKEDIFKNLAWKDKADLNPLPGLTRFHSEVFKSFGIRPQAAHRKFWRSGGFRATLLP